MDDFLRDNRSALSLSPDEWHMFLQDVAPCHTGGKCKETGETNLKEKRRGWYAVSKVVNQLYGRNGTPELCVNDQLHKLILSSIHKAIDEVLGRGNLLQRRPDAGHELRAGGMYYSDAGIRRGVPWWHYALACATAWRAFPQVVITAAWVRLKYIKPEMAAHMLNVHESVIKKGVASLEQWQDVVNKQAYWGSMHKDQDFSGTVRPITIGSTDYFTMAETEKVISDALHAALVPDTLAGFSKTGIELEDVPLSRAIHFNRERAGSALASVSAQPDSMNVGQYGFFKKAVVITLSKCVYWKTNKVYKDEATREDVLEFQHLSLKKRYRKLLDDHSPEIFKTFGPTERQVTFDQFVWGVLKHIHRLPVADLEGLCRTMVGDVKAKSLNPHLIHKKKTVAAVPPAAPEYGPAPAPSFIPLSALASVPGPSADAAPAAAEVPVHPDDAPLSSLVGGAAAPPGAAEAVPCPAVVPNGGAITAKEYLAYINAACPLPPKKKFKVSAKAIAIFAKSKKK